jgi:hypothetical protein
MTAGEVIRAAIPLASSDEIDYIIWGRTSFPFGSVNAKILYKAAKRYDRARINKIQLCEFCDKLAIISGECKRCHDALNPLTIPSGKE